MRLLAGLVTLLLLAACSSGTDRRQPSGPATSSATTPTGNASPETVPETAAPAQPRPEVGECRRLGAKAVVAPTSLTRPVRCGRPHTAQTFHVGRLDLVEAGHRLAVDSPSIQRQTQRHCTSRLAGHLGATPRELRLMMAQTMWFTPTVEDAAAGADWFRCDLVVLAGPEQLARLPRRTKGVGKSAAIAMCATSRPGTKGFTKVACQRRHSWRAVATVDLPGRRFPGVGAAAAAMSARCRDEARSRAEDPLDFDWSEERPTREQWRAGQRYGICWVPA